MLDRAQRNVDDWADAQVYIFSVISTDIIHGRRCILGRSVRSTIRHYGMDDNWSPDLSSFVMLAACRRDQLALEHSTQSNGLFTGLLLDTLESDRVNETTTRRSEKSSMIQLVAVKLRMWQEPIVADGDRKSCRLWFCED